MRYEERIDNLGYSCTTEQTVKFRRNVYLYVSFVDQHFFIRKCRTQIVLCLIILMQMTHSYI